MRACPVSRMMPATRLRGLLLAVGLVAGVGPLAAVAGSRVAGTGGTGELGWVVVGTVADCPVELSRATGAVRGRARDGRRTRSGLPAASAFGSAARAVGAVP